MPLFQSPSENQNHQYQVLTFSVVKILFLFGHEWLSFLLSGGEEFELKHNCDKNFKISRMIQCGYTIHNPTESIWELGTKFGFECLKFEMNYLLLSGRRVCNKECKSMLHAGQFQNLRSHK